MSNPTIGNENQFQNPFNILPDPQLTNPTATNNSQFTTPHVLGTIPTFNILPDYAYDNPTNSNIYQFTTPIVLGLSHTYNILPDTIYSNPTTGQSSQFSGAFNYQSTKFPDPIYGFFKNKFSTTGEYSGNSSFDLTIPSNGTVYGALLRRGQNPTWIPNPGLNSTAGTSLIDDKRKIIYGPFNRRGIALDSDPYRNWRPGPEENSNYNWASFGKAAAGFGANSLGSVFGIPQVSQMSNAAINHMLPEDTARYATFSKKQLGSNSQFNFIQYPDFRNMRFTIGLDKKQDTENPFAEYRNQTLPGTLSLYRIDGTAAAARTLNPITIAYALASASPYGAYTIFNLDGAGKTGYGWGSHDSKYFIRNDFTIRSHVAKAWTDSGWRPTFNPAEVIMPFIGDRVNVIDFNQRSLANIYKWSDRALTAGELHKTQDFIKFYFTGPKLRPGLAKGTDATIKEETDDVIVFRATIGSLSDSFAPGWTSQTMIGRADPNYVYTGYTRDLSLDFTVYATDRDELFFIWRKLNALAGYTAPTYTNTIALEGPWMRLTIGDLFFQVPVVMTSLSYTLMDGDTTWETNIEDDPTMMQVPKKIGVSCGFNIISSDLPQKGGKFYTLAKKFDRNTDEALKGNHNWLSDMKGNSDAKVKEPYRVNRNKGESRTSNEEITRSGGSNAAGGSNTSTTNDVSKPLPDDVTQQLMNNNQSAFTIPRP